jgi:hypothetical protein
MPGNATIESRCARRSSATAEQILHHPQLALAADERRLDVRRAALATSRGDDAKAAGELDALALALELKAAGLRVDDGGLGGGTGGLADEH